MRPNLQAKVVRDGPCSLGIFVLRTVALFDFRWVALDKADLGVGFDPSAFHQGIGLTTMRERLRICGGEQIVASTEGKGKTIIAKLKLEKAKGSSP